MNTSSRKSDLRLYGCRRPKGGFDVFARCAIIACMAAPGDDGIAMDIRAHAQRIWYSVPTKSNGTASFTAGIQIPKFSRKGKLCLRRKAYCLGSSLSSKLPRQLQQRTQLVMLLERPMIPNRTDPQLDLVMIEVSQPVLLHMQSSLTDQAERRSRDCFHI